MRRYMMRLVLVYLFFNGTPTTEIYTLSLHDALPISAKRSRATAKTVAVTSSAASVTSIPESAPHANGPLQASAIAPASAAAGGAPHASAARRSSSAAVAAAATPIVLTMTSDAPAARAPAARDRKSVV